jgi:hypothetical protein
MDKPTAISVSCQNCGAPLDVAEGVRFITCGHCATRLEIVRENSHVYSRLMEAISDVSDRLKAIELQNQIELLDRDYLGFCEKQYGRDKDGSLSEGNSFAAFLFGLVLLVAGIAAIFTPLTTKSSYWLLVVAPFAGYFGYKMTQIAKKMSIQEEDIRVQYQLKRRNLTDELRRARRV